VEEEIKRSVGVHDGNFHADEVVACALLLLFDLVDRDKIVRTRDPQALSACEYVCDVGGVYDSNKKRFDHHQVDYDGVYSSAGMVLTYLLDKKIISKALRDYFYENLIYGVDAHDMGSTTRYGFANFSHGIALFNPVEYTAKPAAYAKGFFEACDYAVGYLQRLKDRFEYNQGCKEAVKKAMDEKKEFLIFSEPLPWVDSFFELGGEKHPAKFLLMPTSQNQWKVRAIPPSEKDKMDTRVPLPAAWSGLMGEALEKVSKIPGAVFCHKGRFVSIWETKESAEKALHEALKGARDGDVI